ncbi:ribonuclease HII [Fictibacillus phosphorivorans]|uniref:ribonuclease HII n=1 Tax=Fictibacillus phosphorivorans TaxID=1221500 RepID=UPI00203E2B99|nr:ribonuclease HII [Fictibacillus phosphorivorans]MCM3717178.1 ribonuclease HII [Fictibacillus phosphorivorans]MCM3774865.1 ribonuclease HII [Fictibacillus phosphorivorans]
MKRSIKEWEQLLKDSSAEEISSHLTQLESDERQGAKKLFKTYTNRLLEAEAELKRLEIMCRYEKQCISNGKRLIAGVDEVGRGPLAGPVVAAAVILPEGYMLNGINDSKKLSEKRREELYERITTDAICYSTHLVQPDKIDEINIYQASKLAMTESVCQLMVEPDQLLIDAMEIALPIDQIKIIKGDEKSISIAAASIIAKVTRDRYMKKLDQMYPHYGFKTNMGYGTKEHLEALKRFGATEIHRKTFSPVGEMIQFTGSE